MRWVKPVLRFIARFGPDLAGELYDDREERRRLERERLRKRLRRERGK